MKKFILTALTAGALAAGGAVQAQDLPSQVLGAILGQSRANPVWGQNPGDHFTYREGDRPYELRRGPGDRFYYYDAAGNIVHMNNVPGVANYGVPYAHGLPQGYAVRPYNGRDFDRDGIVNRRDRDRDGDGVRNRRDRDRDGDGVRNRNDRYPNNPYYR